MLISDCLLPLYQHVFVSDSLVTVEKMFNTYFCTSSVHYKRINKERKKWDKDIGRTL